MRGPTSNTNNESGHLYLSETCDFCFSRLVHTPGPSNEKLKTIRLLSERHGTFKELADADKLSLDTCEPSLYGILRPYRFYGENEKKIISLF
jgi:hypothetical protein